MPTKRIKVVNVELTEKQTSLRFRFYPVPDDETNPEEQFCNNCPLNGLCDLIPDPRNFNDNETAVREKEYEKRTFMDFCIVTGDQSYDEALGDDKFENLVPNTADVVEYARVIGTDVYQKLIERDPYVKLTDVIKNICGEGGYSCPMYNPELTNCSASNRLCVLKRLFKV